MFAGFTGYMPDKGIIGLFTATGHILLLRLGSARLVGNYGVETTSLPYWPVPTAQAYHHRRWRFS